MTKEGCGARWLALAALGTWLGACSSNAPLEQSSGGSGRATTVQLDTTATLPTETCRLLTPREVGDLTGQPVRQQAGGEACRFVQADQPGSPDAVVVVSYRPASAFAIVQTGNRLKRRNILAVNGLGHEAYYDDFHGDLYVGLPDRTLVIGLPRADRSYSRWQVAKALGRLAVARLAAPPAPAAQ
ncbi:hypothetical protein [Hymenobacter properus]|uniref:DUF3558 domain-containing protein n=1 Tax=Hymenobacter properus TaxID=2791026 RepID=A0A931FN58_9BACT|nr:hypothetical protein [Hymenobacter properus]MBF9142319.1 hypothetical protein [Hymenobacter properus]MBR7721126.1 hypothetical protein [Microvirga sp. SRT04]